MKPSERRAILDIPEDLLKLATDAELAVYAHALQIELDLGDLFSYVKHVSPWVEDAPHTVLICKYIDALLENRLYWDGPGPEPILSDEVDEDGIRLWVHPERGDRVVYNLTLHMPPRHGKSLIISEHLPAYLLTKFPDQKVMLASYEQTFAEGWGEKIRDHIEDTAPHFGIHVKNGRKASKSQFSIRGYRGELRTAGAGASITGRGGQTLITDDLISNQQDAKSDIILQDQEDWWHTTWWTRRERWPDQTPCRVINMGTRWTENDIRGRVIEKQKDRWCILNVPALAEPTADEPVDPLGREPGEPLYVKVIGRVELTELRQQSPLWFESLYQGRPFIAEGNIIKKPFQHYRLEEGEDGRLYFRLQFIDGKVLMIPEKDTVRFAALDLAASTKTTADFTALGIFHMTKTRPRYLLVRHIERTRIETDNHAPFLQRMHAIWKFKYVLIEKQSYGTNLIKIMQRQNKIQVRPVSADKDKVTRAQGTISPLLDMRQLFFPEPGTAEWYPEYEKELLSFDNAAHDDQVDVTSYAAQHFINTPRVSTAPDPEDSSPEGRVARHMHKLKTKQKNRGRHPVLGRY